ncbi:mitochondrial-processing peptidase subunit alpha [Rhodnius prolixus]|uniref:Mitochondrial-processing peptidase subunit alpha n=2 Tax=Rhodnius TaxID=13248 RepID=R4FJX1_RHOPR
MVGSIQSIHRIGKCLISQGRFTTRWQVRHLSSQEKKPPPIRNSFNQPPLSTPLPDLEKAIYADTKEEDNVTQVTTLSNGLRVASENKFGQFCTIGVIIESGSRFEVAYPSGISHFLEKLAYNSTTEYADKDKIMLDLEKHGGICDCLSSRDTFIYATSADRRGFDATVNILAEAIIRPKITAQEVETAAQYIRFELETLMSRPEQEHILTDMIHGAAFRDNTLGLPKICPPENIEKIDRNILLHYLKIHYIPSRMVVAGVGIDHNQLVESVQKYFVDKPPVWGFDDGSNLKKIDNSISQYTGGIVQEDCKIPLHMGPSGLPELAHVVIGLEGCSHQDPDFIPMCVLSVMMGGGGSFSAGGPGKGMYTRLYTNVLNRYHWMFNATAYNQTYSDSGLFYIHASAPPNHVRDIVDVIAKEMSAMAGEVGATELRRAKTQLQSMILMNLEARPVVFEDIARQVLAVGHRKLPSTFIQEIENVTKSDIERIAIRLLKSQPCVAARGDIKKLPTLFEIQSALLDKDGFQSKGKLSLFT